MFDHWKLIHEHVCLLGLSMHFCMHVIHHVYIVMSPQLLSPEFQSLWGYCTTNNSMVIIFDGDVLSGPH